MIDFIRSYHNNKTQFEDTVLSEDLFDNVVMTIDPKTNEKGYPITGSHKGFFVKIDDYRAYIKCVPKMILYNFSKLKLLLNKNLSFSNFKTGIDCINGVIDHNSTKLSGVNIGFMIPTTIAGKDIIKINILMHKYKHCNHDLVRNKKEHIKEFIHHNYKIGFYASNKSGEDNFLKVELKLNKSAEFRKFGINNINDLTQKKKLTDLFNLLMKRFDELIIVDSFEYFDGEDYEELKNYLSYSYWPTLSNTKTRQTKSRHKKKFEALIDKYNLDSQKVKLKQQLNKAFTKFISN
jgi:hypothetical protein